ncbi:hypothetical protein U9M48_041420 [Paspalum notatum var. saurae]|uniref:Uncharacterized protein n=1 Tax=Paspalum notatum var. saurae TaxID=547442 RepID=A0AAQ3UT39_PASNO
MATLKEWIIKRNTVSISEALILPERWILYQIQRKQRTVYILQRKVPNTLCKSNGQGNKTKLQREMKNKSSFRTGEEEELCKGTKRVKTDLEYGKTGDAFGQKENLIRPQRKTVCFEAEEHHTSACPFTSPVLRRSIASRHLLLPPLSSPAGDLSGQAPSAGIERCYVATGGAP